MAVEGDAGAFGALYDLHVDRIHRHVRFRVGQVEEAEDITAQVFLNAWQKIRRYRSMGLPFVVWLLRIADNLVISAYRKRRYISQAVSDELTASLPDEGSIHVLDQRIDHEMLREALSRLHEDQQRVLVLRFVEDLSSAQVAAIMGKSDGAVRVLQYRALAALREIVSKRTVGVEARSAS